MSTTQRLFSQRLSSEMERQERSIEWLADICGVRAITVQRWLRAETDPKVDFAGRAAEALGVSLDWLAGLTDERELVA